MEPKEENKNSSTNNNSKSGKKQVYFDDEGVLWIKARPLTAISQNNFSSVAVPIDNDTDQIPSCFQKRIYENYKAEETKGIYAFDLDKVWKSGPYIPKPKIQMSTNSNKKGNITAKKKPFCGTLKNQGGLFGYNSFHSKKLKNEAKVTTTRDYHQGQRPQTKIVSYGEELYQKVKEGDLSILYKCDQNYFEDENDSNNSSIFSINN